MPLQQTSGAASYDAFGGGAPVAAKYIEDFFQSWLRTGTGSSTTVTTGLNASINKSLVWTKSRSAATNHKLTDTARGVTKALSSNTTGAEVTDSQGLTAFNSTGYTIGTNTDYNNSGATYVDWQLVATPKFFDVVTYTGNGSTQTIAHNLNAVPGVVIIKCTSSTGNWSYLYNFEVSLHNVLFLNLTNAAENSSYNSGNRFSQRPTSTNIFLGSEGDTNANGATYVAYVFAHNAGGFGLTGTDNVISCGSYTGNGSASGPVINLGYEPQWLLIKRATGGIGGWSLIDNMRGMSMSNDALLAPNNSDAESSLQILNPTATGFQISSTDTFFNASGDTYIYIAIRRGPMRTPTTGTSVFAPVAYAGDNLDNRLVNTGVLTDMAMARARSRTSAGGFYTADRLRGDEFLRTAGSDAALTDSDTFMTPTIGVGNSFSAMNGFGVGNDATYRVNTESDQFTYALRRAPGFMDVVCYTGTGVATTIPHNLGVVPELMIVKRRNNTADWQVYSATFGSAFRLRLNLDAAVENFSVWNNTDPTASVFSISNRFEINFSGSTYVAYLFASCPGVSKVGSYTGNDVAGRIIDCGFTSGARFVLLKCTSQSGDWQVWDSARGITSGNDPYLLLNSTAAEVTGTNYVDTHASGFKLNAFNSAGDQFIFLAIA